MRIFATSIAAAVALQSFGCSGLRANAIVSAGHVGCLPEEIEIHEVESGLGGVVWTAACKGKTFVCTAGDGVYCAELRAGGE